MAQDINSILQELDAGYNPQRQAINDQIAQLQPQADQQIQGLNQTKDTAYRDISRSAADRGMYFSSIPSQDQADYVQKTYVPALAGVQQSMNQSKNSLLDSLNNLNIQQRTQAYGIRDNQATLEEQKRQFDAQQAAALAQQKAAAASQASLGSILGGGGSTAAQAPAKKAPTPTDKVLTGGKSLQDATGALQQLLTTKNSSLIRSTLSAIQSSARQGNTYDQAKLQIINSRPEFKQYLANFNGATF